MELTKEQGPLYEVFRDAGAVFERRSGVYTAASTDGLMKEYRHVRERLGIADMSDSVVLRIIGPQARDHLDEILTCPFRSMADGTMRMCLLLDESGRFVADMLVFAGFDDYMILADRAHRLALLAALDCGGAKDVTVEDCTDRHAIIRIDGPEAADLPGELYGIEASGLGLMSHLALSTSEGNLLLGRVGSVGEFGYIIVCPPAAGKSVISRIRKAASGSGFCGRDVYDLLHLEMRAFNFRRDLSDDMLPLEAGLHWMIDFRKPYFLGSDALADQLRNLKKRLVCLTLDGDEPPVSKAPAVLVDGDQVGYGQSFAVSPFAGKVIGLAYLDPNVALSGLPVVVDGLQGRTCSAPFVRTISNARTG